MTAALAHDVVEDNQYLLARARTGDARALDALLARHQAQIYRFGMKMCRDSEDAQDVLQNTLFTLAKGVRDFRAESSISTWLYSVARSFCVKMRRTSKFAPEREFAHDAELPPTAERVADPAKSPDDALAGKRAEHALAQAIAALEPMYRDVLLLRDVEGLTALEAAQALGLSVQAVKSRLHRARASVRAHLAPLNR